MNGENFEELWQGWKTVRRIGNGSFGTVYEIQRDIFGEVERAALKVIRIPHEPEEIEELRNMGYDDRAISLRFRNCLESIVKEYSIMARLKGNSNIVDCDDLSYEPAPNGVGWQIRIRMELLTPMLRNLENLQREEEILRLGKDLCKALIACKSRNIIHRDIKPQNIFVSDDGNYKLGDFGIAKTAEITCGGTKTGTYNYMAPEVYNNRPYGAAADIYSLGIVLYWLLNERRMPFMPLPPQIPTVEMDEATRQRRFKGEEVPPPAHGSPAFRQAVLQACAFAPENRFESAEAFLQALTIVEQEMERQKEAQRTDFGQRNISYRPEEPQGNWEGTVLRPVPYATVGRRAYDGVVPGETIQPVERNRPPRGLLYPTPVIEDRKKPISENAGFRKPGLGELTVFSNPNKSSNK